MFGTPGRAGVNYDEFANGCMHKASSQNLPEDVKFPYWLKLERHGDYFVGSISLDGENWINEKRSEDIPGLEKEIDLGLAAGSPDQIPYWVDFEDWTVKVAKQ
jgi:regulation of enolase protein 1 (concanavalin A-like superfamily)